MNLKSLINSFANDEAGAVTVDWVVLTAAVVGLGVASAGAVRSGTTALGTDINIGLTSASVVALGELGDVGLPWSYSLLAFSASDQDYWINTYLATWSSDSIAMNYEYRANWLLDNLMANNADTNIDTIYFYSLALQDRGLSIPAGAPTVEQVYTAWRAANP